MPVESFRFESNTDGMSLQGWKWPVPDPSLVLVIAHGAAEHSLRYERFAAALNASGIEAWSLDHRGHGQSPGPEGLGDMGEGGWDALVADIGQVIGMIHRARPGLPVALFGHSMGAAAAQQYVLDGSDTIDALVLSGSTAREVRPEGGAAPATSGVNSAFEPARTPYDWLSRDKAEVDRYIADPLCGFEGRSTRGSRANPFALADPDRLRNIRDDLPCLLLAGDADPINRKLEGLRLLEKRWHDAGVRQIDKLFYAGGRHEMLNETNRDEVTADVIAWLTQGT